MSDPRDVELGTRLDELEVREHEEGYWSAVMAGAAPELDRLREEERASRQGSFAAFVERHPIFGGGFKWWATAAVAAAVAIVLLLVGLPGGEQVTTVVGPAPATAAEAAGYALNALDRYPGLEGTLDSRLVGVTPENARQTEVTFVADRDGSLWLERRWQDGSFAPHWLEDAMAYDARARTLGMLADLPIPSVDAESGQSYQRTWSERSGLAPAEPDRRLMDGWFPFPLWRVRAYLRTVIGDPEARLATIEKDGRAVWVLSAETVEEEDWSSGDFIEPVAAPVTITIDAATRLPLSLEHAAAPHVAGEVTTFDLRPLSEAPARDRFTLQRPDDPGTHIMVAPRGLDDMGFRDLPLGDDEAVREATSGMAAFPRWLPRGFTPSASTAKDDGNGWAWYRPAPAEPKELLRITIVSLAFRRGYDQAFVSVRVDPRLHSAAFRGSGEDKVRIDTSDPFVEFMAPEAAALWAAHTADVSLEKGAFAGATAHVVTEPTNWPHLWVRKGPYVACVAGDLTVNEMLRIAESLGPWSAAVAE